MSKRESETGRHEREPITAAIRVGRYELRCVICAALESGSYATFGVAPGGPDRDQAAQCAECGSPDMSTLAGAARCPDCGGGEWAALEGRHGWVSPEWPSYCYWPLVEGGWCHLYDRYAEEERDEGDPEPEPYRLDRAALQRGLDVLVAGRHWHLLQQVISGAADAGEADAYLQACLLGEIVYG